MSAFDDDLALLRSIIAGWSPSDRRKAKGDLEAAIRVIDREQRERLAELEDVVCQLKHHQRGGGVFGCSIPGCANYRPAEKP